MIVEEGSRGAPPGGHVSVDDPSRASRKSLARFLWVLFTFFVIYGTTIPFRFVADGNFADRVASRLDWSLIGDSRGYGHGLPDIVQNILLFIPFGFLGYYSLVNQRSRLKKTFVVLMGAALSGMVEFLQLFTTVRFTSLSDVVFNTLGTGLGVLAGMALKQSVMGFKSLPWARRFLDAESAWPALVFLGLALAGCWQPFDFALDVGNVWGKVKPLLEHPVDFSWPDDDLTNFIRFLLASLFACRLAKEAGLRRPAATGVILMAWAGLGLEATQVIITSRTPQFQDALVAVLGALGGGVAFRFPGFREHPGVWSATGALAVMASAVMRGLHPYRFSGHGPSGFNWIPFLPQFDQTSMNSLGNFLESGLAYFPLGFMLAYLYPGSRHARWAALLLAAGTALAVEIVQGWVAGRYSDVTDVVGALLGACLGILTVTRGWGAFRHYMEEDPRMAFRTETSPA